MNSQRPMQRQCVAHGALRAIRGHGVNFADGPERLFESRKTFGLDAVIVRKQDDHALYCGKEARSSQAREKSPSIHIFPQSPFFKGEVAKIGKRNFHKRHSKGLRFCVPLFEKEGPGEIFGRELYSEPTTPRHLSGPCLQRWATI
jgi:hypothetical protein